MVCVVKTAKTPLQIEKKSAGENAAEEQRFI